MSDLDIRIPTDEQQAVIDATEDAFTVIAAAGAGKTFVLVERYLRHVQDEGLLPDQILTITFTKKAAAEMKTRIVRRLRAKGLYNEAQIAETGPIQTIHSFCERLLRENALEAGLDPQFEIMGEAQASRLTVECIREALASSLDEEPDAEGLIRFLAGKRPGFGENKSPYGILEDALTKVLQDLRSSPFSRNEISDQHGDVSSLSRFWEQKVREALSPETLDLLDGNDGDLNARIQLACKQSRIPVPAWAKGKGDASAEQQALQHTCGLVQLACAAWWRLDREMNGRQTLDFAALEIRADRLLTNSEVTRARLREQYRVVMVDESQDVNPIQYKLLKQLGSERTMMVGDAQQSIYGFRQADVRLFQQRSAATSTKRLSKNWRSAPGILNFVDTVFGRLWGAEYRPMNLDVGPMNLDTDSSPSFEGVEIWRQAPKDPVATARFITQLIDDDGVKPNDIAVLVRDSQGALSMQQALSKAGIANRITGGSERFYTRLEVRDLANTIRALTDPYDDFALLSTLRSPMVGLALDSIAMLGLHSPVVEELTSFEPPLTEDIPRLATFLAWFSPLQKIADRLSAWEVLAEIFAQSDYLPALARRANADQTLANARKLLTLAAQEPELGPLEFAEQIREIQDLRHKEGDAPADDDDAPMVRITTIHKAKGLEWPVVVVPQTDKKLAGRAREVIVDPSQGLVATKFGRNASLMHKLLTENRKRREDEEEKRVLYVALTRAQERLCICIMPATNTATASKLLSGVIDPERMPGLRIRDGGQAM